MLVSFKIIWLILLERKFANTEASIVVSFSCQAIAENWFIEDTI